MWPDAVRTAVFCSVTTERTSAMARSARSRKASTTASAARRAATTAPSALGPGCSELVDALLERRHRLLHLTQPRSSLLAGAPRGADSRGHVAESRRHVAMGLFDPVQDVGAQLSHDLGESGPLLVHGGGDGLRRSFQG